MDTIIKLTSDGSHTLYVPELNEHYHSHFGAVTESMHIFINAGLRNIQGDSVTILEVGFGTGLNALLTALYASEHRIKVDYTSLEKYPLDDSVVSKLNYGSLTGKEGMELFAAIHSAPWDKPASIIEWFTLHKRVTDLTTEQPEGLFDLVFFDAFGPDKQPEMWSGEVMRKIAAVMHAGSVFVTYSAKGSLKRILRKLQMEVNLLPGPPGKRVFTRAVKL
ncbi:MAG: tRNA (5-methylaminomethyl-2-thiouridine)(34)-methyltransferase MnmD [Bacteroidales bacterium]|nr:tRNA (5-methylaminomethyl-2-thiouridine)(34)-methyltransferase MnmD [Bacteroidales bacterium]MDT8374164.1 tRNA (5-methylaminomethyl-2-thiouridine)(34)-methyltransferase MnmD [Bacteroidales bacterium]